MATKASTAPKNNEPPPHQTFREPPSAVFVQGFLEHVKATGDPESYKGLYLGKIDRDEEFSRRAKFTIDPKKRLSGDWAYCPRCGQKDKFLSGDLAWFPRLMVCAAIGHCCAGHEAARAAEDEYKARTGKYSRESVLLANLPVHAERLAVLQQLRAPFSSAQGVHRQMIRGAGDLHTILRGLKKSQDGRLIVSRVLRDDADEEVKGDYVGPAGFRGGAGSVVTHDTVLGRMVGQIALNSSFNPLKDLDLIIGQMTSIGEAFPDDILIDHICGLSVRQQEVAESLIKYASSHVPKLMDRVDEFWRFFSPGNIVLLHSYGTHPESPVHFEITHTDRNGQAEIVIRGPDGYCRINIPGIHAVPLPDWPRA